MQVSLLLRARYFHTRLFRAISHDSSRHLRQVGPRRVTRTPAIVSRRTRRNDVASPVSARSRSAIAFFNSPSRRRLDFAYSATRFLYPRLSSVTYARWRNKFHLVSPTGTEFFLHSRTCTRALLLGFLQLSVFLFIVAPP